MKTFTFVVKDNCKRHFVCQSQSEELTKDLMIGMVNDMSHISRRMKYLLLDEVMEWYAPAYLPYVNNVWRDLYLIEIKKCLCLYDVSMIKTDMSNTVFPLSEKATFTFVTHIRNWNSFDQFEVTTLEEGLMLWATSFKFLNRQQRKILLKYIRKSKNFPKSVEGVKNVWSTSYRIFRPLLTLHIIKTVPVDEK